MYMLSIRPLIPPCAMARAHPMRRCCAIAGLLLAAACLQAIAVAGTTAKQPNFVVIITDDQSDLLDDTRPEVMPELNKLLIEQGQRFVNYFVTTPICCPSRVSLLRGQYAHNHNFTDVLGPVGGFAKFHELGIEESYLPTWLQDLGYNTYYVGKFLVDYSVANYNNTPKGWTDIDAVLLPFLFQYYDPVFSRNGNPPSQFKGQYSTDVVADKALAQIVSAVQAGKPFYSQISPVAPHFSSGGPTSPLNNDTNVVPGDCAPLPPCARPRHWNLFNDLELPKPLASFDEEDVTDKPAWIRSLPRQSRGNLTYLEEIYRNRLRSLRAVDELVGRVVRQLEQLGVLDNTYIIFTADNGYHLGTHRRPSGKLSSYEEDIRVPFIIRGPGLQPGIKVLEQAAHVDIAPTVLALAGAIAPEEIDGSPLPLIRGSPNNTKLPVSYPKTTSSSPNRGQLPLSYFAGGNGDFDEYFNGTGGLVGNLNWTWRSIRVHDQLSEFEQPDGNHWRNYPRQSSYKYTVHCTNERELYDLRLDPNEASNLLQYAPTWTSRLYKRIDVLFQVLQTCWGPSCRYPFQTIHNNTKTPVKTLWDAVDKTWDRVYDKIPQFEFKTCLNVQDYANEINYYREILGAFPRQDDGKKLAHINVKPYGKAPKKRSNRRRLASGHAPVTVVGEMEKFAVPLTYEQLHLTDEQLFGPKGNSLYMA